MTIYHARVTANITESDLILRQQLLYNIYTLINVNMIRCTQLLAHDSPFMTPCLMRDYTCRSTQRRLMYVLKHFLNLPILYPRSIQENSIDNL